MLRPPLGSMPKGRLAPCYRMERHAGNLSEFIVLFTQ